MKANTCVTINRIFDYRYILIDLHTWQPIHTYLYIFLFYSEHILIKLSVFSISLCISYSLAPFFVDLYVVFFFFLDQKVAINITFNFGLFIIIVIRFIFRHIKQLFFEQNTTKIATKSKYIRTFFNIKYTLTATNMVWPFFRCYSCNTLLSIYYHLTTRCLQC